MGLLLPIFFLRDPPRHAELESQLSRGTRHSGIQTSFREVFSLTSWRDRSLFSASQAGLVNNLTDAVVWGLVPLALAAHGLGVGQIGVTAATAPSVRGT